MKKNEMVIFDLDGTLWETTDVTYESANEIMNKYKINHEITKETIIKTMGCNFQESAENYMPDIDEEYRIRLLKEINDLNSQKLCRKGGKVYTNLEDVLIKLKKKYKLAIVSNCVENYIESFLESSNLELYFDDFIAASKMKISKSDAIKQIIERNNISSAIYVGDTLKDYEASEEAGIKFIHARYGFGKTLKSEYGINNITELPEMIENLKY